MAEQFGPQFAPQPAPEPDPGVPHPLADRVGQADDGTRWVATETRSRIVHLSAARANLLALAARDERRPVLISDELSSLTPAFARIWRDSGGTWVVRQADGALRNGFDGRRLSRIEESWTRPRPQSVDDYSIGYLRIPEGADILQVTTLVGLRHPARERTLLGEPLDVLTERMNIGAGLAWGTHEPVGEPWDRRRVTDAIRAEMPRLTTVVAAGPDLSATIAAQRTEFGVEEIDHLVTGIGAPDDAGFAAVRSRSADVFRRVAETGMPLVGLQLVHPGRRDLAVPPYLLPPPLPLALFVGAPAVRSFGLDVALMRERHGAEVVGRPRLPALLFELGPVGLEAWQRLDRILAAFNPKLLEEALGMAAGSLSRIRSEAPSEPDPDTPDPDTPHPDTPDQEGGADA